MKELPDFVTKKLDRAFTLLEDGQIAAAKDLHSSLQAKFSRYPEINCLKGAIKFSEGFKSEGVEILLKTADESKDEQSYGFAVELSAKALYPGIAVKYYKKLKRVSAFNNPQLNGI